MIRSTPSESPGAALGKAMGEAIIEGVERSCVESEKISRLTEAGCFALGWILAKGGPEEPAAYWLASALKANGVDSIYIDDILRKRDGT